MKGEPLLLAVCLAVYAAGVAGLAIALGGWLGWAVVAAAGAVPGAAVWRQRMVRDELDQARRLHAPEPRRPQPPPAREDGPAPDPLQLPWSS